VTSPSCTGFQSLPNKGAEFVQLDDIRQIFVENRSGFSKQAFGGPEFSENLDSLRAPQKFGKCDCIDTGIHLDGAFGFKVNPATRAGYGDLDAPPIRDFALSLLDVPFTDNECRAIENVAIDRYLARQPLQGVSVTFDFIPVQVAVHDGDIDTTSTMTKAKFVEHQGISISVMLLEHLSVQRLPYISISHGRSPIDHFRTNSSHVQAPDMALSHERYDRQMSTIY
jgi:hypothetical protein